MANYYASCRTNYFKVKDSAKFLKAMEQVNDIEVINKVDNIFCLLGNSPDGGGWPHWVFDEETGEEREFDLPEAVAWHLEPESVAVFKEVGYEKLRYLTGYAEAINSKGEIRIISIDDIYELAAELGSDVTLAQY